MCIFEYVVLMICFCISSESGPLMISPTGQIIVPAACPGSIVVDFMSNHLQEASQKADEYKVYVEIYLSY